MASIEKQGTHSFDELEEAIGKRHSHDNKALLDTYDQTNANITDAVAKKHEHANKTLLDTYNQSNSDIENAINNTHNHANKALLDTYTQTEADLSDAVSKKHEHANKALLDTYTQSETDLADAVSKKHEHLNKAVLDTITFNQTKLSEMDTEIDDLQSDAAELYKGIIYKAKDLVNTNDYEINYAGLTQFDDLRINLTVLNPNTFDASLSLNGAAAVPIKWKSRGVWYDLDPNMIDATVELQYHLSDNVYELLTKQGKVPSSEITQTTSIAKVGDGDTSDFSASILNGKAVEFGIGGDSAVQEIENSDAELPFIPSGVGNILRIQSSGQIVIDNSYNAAYQSVRVSTGDKVLLVLKTDVGSLLGNGGLQYSDSVSDSGGVSSVGNLAYFIVTATRDDIGNVYFLENNVGVTDSTIPKIITAINLTALSKQSYTQEEAFQRYGQKALATGLNHAQGKITVTGKNLFNKASGLYGYGINPGNGQLLVFADRYTSGYIQVIPGENVTISGDAFINNQNIDIHFYDSNENWIKRKLPFAATLPFTFNIDEPNANKIRLAWYEGSPSSNLNVDTVQLELGTEATEYEAYKFMEYDYGELKSTPNGVADSRNPLTGEDVRRIAPVDKPYKTVQSADITSVISGSNLQRILIPLTALDGIKPQTSSASGEMLIEKLIGETTNANFDTAGFEEYWFTDATNLAILKPLGTYTDLADAQAKLSEGGANELRFIYQLETPIIKQVESEQLFLDKGGTIQDDSAVQSVKTYKVNLNGEARNNGLVEAMTRLEKDVDRALDNTSIAQDDTGIVNEIVIATEQEPKLKEVFTIIPNITNTGACTIKFNSNDALALEKVDATGSDTALVAGDIVANKPTWVMNRGDKYILI